MTETRLLDVVRKISNKKVYSDQLNTSNEYSCLENEEDGDDDIILVEPNEIEKEVDILINFNSIQLKDEGLVRLIKETLHGNESDLVKILGNSISSFFFFVKNMERSNFGRKMPQLTGDSILNESIMLFELFIVSQGVREKYFSS